MGSVETVAAAAGITLERLGSTSLVRVEDAVAFLDEAGREGVTVIGVEGFRIDAGAITPDMDAILDLSGVDDPAQSVTEAKSFVGAVGEPGLLFEFVLAARDTAR
jgi:hypothetical protein